MFVNPKLGFVQSSLQWIEKIWHEFALGNGSKRKTRILMDDFTVHMVGFSVNTINNCSTEVDYFLPGYTSRLQVLVNLLMEID